MYFFDDFLIGPKLVPEIKQIGKNISAETSASKRGKPSRGEGGERGGGKPLPLLGGLGGSEVQKEKRFGGSEKGVSDEEGLEEGREIYTQTPWLGGLSIMRSIISCCGGVLVIFVFYDFVMRRSVHSRFHS